MRSCFEISTLVSAELDRPLKVSERMELKLHTSMCPHCKRFRKNIQFLQQAMTHYGENHDK